MQLTQRNCVWPIQRGPKSWDTAHPPKALESLLLHLLRTRPGSYPTSMAYGTEIHQYRNTGFSETDRIHITDSIKSSVQKYIPEISIQSVSFDKPPNTQTCTITIVWGVGEILNAPPTLNQQRGGLGPFKTTMVI